MIQSDNLTHPSPHQIESALFISSFTFAPGDPIRWMDQRPAIDNVVAVEFVTCAFDPVTMLVNNFVTLRSRELHSRFFPASRNASDIIALVPVAFTSNYMPAQNTPTYKRRTPLSNVDFAVHTPNGTIATAITAGTVLVILKIYTQ